MIVSNHALSRMGQRAITKKMIRLVLTYGEVINDRVFLNRKLTSKLIEEKQEELKTLKKILDKGGLTVVEKDNTIITTFNVQGRQKRKWK